MPLSVGQLRRTKWTLAFEYDESQPPMHMRIYTNKVAPKITMAHVRSNRDPDAKTDIQFRSHGRKCPTLADAVRMFNAEEERRHRASRGETLYRPKTTRRAKASLR